MATIRQIQYNVTRPTSATVLLVLFELVKIFVNIPDPVENGIYTTITVVGTSGLIEKAWKNRRQISYFLKSIFTKKQKQNG